MANKTCYSSLQVCRLRVSLLDDAGNVDLGPSSSYVTDALIELGYNLVIKKGADLTQEDGCGNICSRYKGFDRIDSVDLTLQLCQLDAELIELLTGASLVQVGGNSRGFAIPDPATDLNRQVAIEAWTRAWDGDQQAVVDGAAAHYRYIFPNTSWVLGNSTLKNAIQVQPLTGHGRSNSQFSDGPADDLPSGAFVTPMGVWLDEDPLPAANCGYQPITSS